MEDQKTKTVTWYEAWFAFNEIKPIEVESHTQKTITTQGRRYARFSESYAYCRTKSEAKEAILAYHQGKIDDLEKQLSRRREELADAEAIEI